MSDQINEYIIWETGENDREVISWLIHRAQRRDVDDACRRVIKSARRFFSNEHVDMHTIICAYYKLKDSESAASNHRGAQ